MRRALVVGGASLVAALLAAQLVPVERTNPPVVAKLEAPPEVRELLQRACSNCHSYETRWPWYSRVAPVSWLVVHDVNEARKKLNLSTWGTLDPRRRARLREEMWEEVSQGEMPLPAYRLAHPEARLSDADRDILRAWTAAVSEDR